MSTVVILAVAAGAVIGLCLGSLGGGGSILAVPVLIFALDQSPAQATTGSLVVVGTTSLIAAATAYRAGNVLLGRGIGFAVVATGGAWAGAKGAAQVPGDVLLAAFAVLMLVIGSLMAWQQLRHHRGAARPTARRPELDAPIITFSPTFACQWPRALMVLLAATAVGLLTGFLGVGGGFLIVPALLLVLGLPMRQAAGTSLVVITITSVAALVVRASTGAVPDWGPVVALAAASSMAGMAGARLAVRVATDRLQAAFTVLVLGVAVFTAVRALPRLM